ncbi:hypothetical protein C8Q80DRAFT_1203398 [Daedaleopsis nitida]|nr:hypothetical protein C8Q80DRAFT_1203398 [Daedaleopsis nitida]
MPSVHISQSYRTLCTLPNELLYQIVSELVALTWKPEKSIKTCSLVCRCLRPICQELLFKNTKRLRFCEEESFHSALLFLQAQPKVSRRITTLELMGYVWGTVKSWPTITPNLLARIAGCLPQLRRLTLCHLRVDDDEAYLPLSILPAASDGRVPLQHLSFSMYAHDESSLSAILCIISLFKLDELEFNSSFHPRRILPSGTLSHALPTLHVRRMDSLCLHGAPLVAPFLRLLALYASSSHLQVIRVAFVDLESIRTLGDLLSGPARNIIELEIISPAPYAMVERQGWKDPLDEHWPSLRLSACSKLEALTLHIHMCLKAAEVPLCATPAALVSAVSSSLKTVTIYVDKVPAKNPSSLSDNRLMKLQAVNETLVVAGRFPHIQILKLYIRTSQSDLDAKSGYWNDCVAACKKALPAVHAAGRLKVERA